MVFKTIKNKIRLYIYSLLNLNELSNQVSALSNKVVILEQELNDLKWNKSLEELRNKLDKKWKIEY